MICHDLQEIGELFSYVGYLYTRPSHIPRDAYECGISNQEYIIVGQEYGWSEALLHS